MSKQNSKKILQLFKTIGRGFLDLLYPPFCLHCNHSLTTQEAIFCSSCLTLMPLIDPQERCPYCFSPHIELPQEACCADCRQHPPLTTRIGAAFDYEGPAATLIKAMKYGNKPFLAEGVAAYMVAQFLRMEWPMPDMIVPMPMPLLRRMERGYNQSLLLAQAFGKLIQCPVKDLLSRRSGDFSQAGLDYQRRLRLDVSAFSVKKGTRLHDKCVLLIDDVMTTGKSLRCCAEVLSSCYPANIYAFTACRVV